MCLYVCISTQGHVKISQVLGCSHVYMYTKVCAKILNVCLQRMCIYDCQFDSVSQRAPRSIFICE